MPFIFAVQLATPGNLTSNGSANTETETCFVKPGATAPSFLQLLSLGGKGAAASTLSALELRCGKWGTASAGGTAMSLVPRDGISTAISTASSRSTAGTTRTNLGVIVSSGITSPGLWQSNDPDTMPSVRAANAGSLFVADVGTSVSMPFSFSAEIREF